MAANGGTPPAILLFHPVEMFSDQCTSDAAAWASEKDAYEEMFNVPGLKMRLQTDSSSFVTKWESYRALHGHGPNQDDCSEMRRAHQEVRSMIDVAEKQARSAWEADAPIRIEKRRVEHKRHKLEQEMTDLFSSPAPVSQKDPFDFDIFGTVKPVPTLTPLAMRPEAPRVSLDLNALYNSPEQLQNRWPQKELVPRIGPARRFDTGAPYSAVASPPNKEAPKPKNIDLVAPRFRAPPDWPWAAPPAALALAGGDEQPPAAFSRLPPSSPKPKKRKSIPKRIRELVWNKNFGLSRIGSCYCCQDEISILNWECSHILASVHGGLEVESNLRACCRSCNRSMGDEHMDIFKARCYP